MKRPEKKECSDENPYNCLECGDEGWVYGYNQAIDDMDKFEPTVEEIEEIMTDHYWDSLEGERGILERHCKFLAKAIHKRLTKE